MSEHKQPKPATTGIVTSDQVLRKTGPRTLWSWFALGLLALVIVGAGGGLLYRHYIYDPAHKPATAPKTSNNHNALKQFDTALTDAKTRLDTAAGQKQKATAYVNLGVAYMNKAQYKDAILALNNAIAADASIKLEALSVLAFAYAYDNQRDKAISTFQEVISLLQKQNSDDADARVQAYQNDLQRLQAGQGL